MHFERSLAKEMRDWEVFSRNIFLDFFVKIFDGTSFRVFRTFFKLLAQKIVANDFLSF